MKLQNPFLITSKFQAGKVLLMLHTVVVEIRDSTRDDAASFIARPFVCHWPHAVTMSTDSSQRSTVNGVDGQHIIDIRSDAAGIELKQEILKGLKPQNGEKKTLPTLLLYDEAGLRLFEEITYLDEYYLTNQEIWILENYADRIAERIPNDSLIVELGSGCAPTQRSFT